MISGRFVEHAEDLRCTFVEAGFVVLTPSEAQTILDALSAAKPGEGHDISVAKALVDRETVSEVPASKLTPRERQVLVRLIRGQGPGEVAEQLGISRKTFDTYRYNLLQKLGLRGNIELVYWALQHGEIGTGDLRPVWSRAKPPRRAASTPSEPT